MFGFVDSWSPHQALVPLRAGFTARIDPMLSLARSREGVFKLVSGYRPEGDQPAAIEALTRNLNEGVAQQVLLGVTGSGKTFTMANVVAQVNRPTLVIAP